MGHSDLDRIYAVHPLQLRTIVARLARQHIPLLGVTEEALAFDSETQITDQNHVGGAPFVLALARTAGVNQRDLVIDIGSGLGGSARLLASLFACRIWAIEQDLGRHLDALALTSLVSLGDRVTLIHADAAVDPSPIAQADVLWGQSAWIHFADKGAFLAKWRSVLRPGGRLALEDAYLRRPPATLGERQLLAELERSWGAVLVPIRSWQEALENNGCSISLTEDLTGECWEHFAALLRVSTQWPVGDLTAEERMGWQRAQEAIRAGLVGYFRILAHARPIPE